MAANNCSENASGSKEDVVRLTESGKECGLKLSDIIIRQKSTSYTVLIEPAKTRRPGVENTSEQKLVSSSKPPTPTVNKRIHFEMRDLSVPAYDVRNMQQVQERASRLNSKWPTTIMEAKRRERLRALGRCSSSDTCSRAESIPMVNIIETPGTSFQSAKNCLPVQRVPGQLIVVQPASESQTIIGKFDQRDKLSDNQEHTRKTGFLSSTEEVDIDNSNQANQDGTQLTDVSSQADQDGTQVTDVSSQADQDGTQVTNVSSQADRIEEDEDTTLSPETANPPRKKRGKLRRAIRMIGKCLSNWCGPALDTRD